MIPSPEGARDQGIKDIKGQLLALFYRRTSHQGQVEILWDHGRWWATDIDKGGTWCITRSLKNPKFDTLRKEVVL